MEANISRPFSGRSCIRGLRKRGQWPQLGFERGLPMFPSKQELPVHYSWRSFFVSYHMLVTTSVSARTDKQPEWWKNPFTLSQEVGRGSSYVWLCVDREQMGSSCAGVGLTIYSDCTRLCLWDDLWGVCLVLLMHKVFDPEEQDVIFSFESETETTLFAAGLCRPGPWLSACILSIYPPLCMALACGPLCCLLQRPCWHWFSNCPICAARHGSHVTQMGSKQLPVLFSHDQLWQIQQTELGTLMLDAAQAQKRPSFPFRADTLSSKSAPSRFSKAVLKLGALVPVPPAVKPAHPGGAAGDLNNSTSLW